MVEVAEVAAQEVLVVLVVPASFQARLPVKQAWMVVVLEVREGVVVPGEVLGAAVISCS